MKKKGDKKHKKKISNVRLLSKYKTAIMKSAQKEGTFLKVKEELPISLYEEMISWINNSIKLKELILGPIFPTSIQDIKIKFISSSNNIIREFIWAWLHLMNYSEEISFFINHVREFERSVLTSDYEKGGNILDIIEKEFGISLWLIKNRVSFLQLTQGLEAQKRYSTRLKQEAIDDNPIVAFIIHLISLKTEPVVTPGEFIELFANLLPSHKIQKDIYDYFRFHLIPGFLPSESAMPKILSWQNFGNLIDYYYSTLSMLTLILSNSTNYENIKKMLPSKKQVETFNDPRLITIDSLINISSAKSGLDRTRCFDAFEENLKQNYFKSFELALKELADRPNDFTSLEVAAQCLSMIDSVLTKDKDQLLWDLLLKMKSVISKDKDSRKSALELKKFSWDFYQLPCGINLLSFLIKEYSNNPLENNDGFTIYATLFDYLPNPSRIVYYKDFDLRLSYSSLFKGISPVIDEYRNICVDSAGFCKLGSLAKEEHSLLIANRMYQDGRYSEALECSKELLGSNLVYRQKGLRLYVNCLLELDLMEETISYIAHVYLNDPNLSDMLPINKLMDKIDEKKRLEYANKIEIPILYDILIKNGEREFENLRAYSCEDFLTEQNFDRPSDLETIIEKFERKSIIYFLSTVCIEQVMDNFVTFSSSEEVALERIDICRLLIGYDSENSEKYQSEIKNIMQRLTLQKKMREIEKNKIYIDIDNIRQNAEKMLKESFNRYLSFLKGGLDADSFALRKTAKESAEKGDVEGLLSIALPDNEMNLLFESIVVALRDKFVSSSEHGLDGYLSVRIRHGALYSHLRGPLEQNHLITQKTGKKGQYKRNVHWIKKLNLVNEIYINQLLKNLDDFSREFDSLVDTINNEWVQVKVNRVGKGLFDFTLYKPTMALLSTQIEENTTFGQFLDIIFEHLFATLESSLKNIRNKIQNTAKNKANDLLNDLHAKIEKLNHHIDTGELLVAIGRLTTAVQISFDRVMEWFRFFRTEENEPFSIEDVINIAKESVKISCSNFQTNLTMAGEMKDNRIKGKMPSFVDIIFLVFENIIKHSKLETDPHADITVRHSTNNIIIRIENEVDKSVFNDSNRDKIEKIKQIISKREYGDAIKKEGGTGLQKLHKILFHDFKLSSTELEPYLTFGFKNDKYFFVEISIPFILYKQES